MALVLACTSTLTYDPTLRLLWSAKVPTTTSTGYITLQLTRGLLTFLLVALWKKQGPLLSYIKWWAPRQIGLPILILFRQGTVSRSGIPVLLTRTRPLNLLILNVQTGLHPGRAQMVRLPKVPLILLVKWTYREDNLLLRPIPPRTLVVPCKEEMVKKPDGTRKERAAVLLDGWKSEVTRFIGPMGPFSLLYGNALAVCLASCRNPQGLPLLPCRRLWKAPRTPATVVS